jgi:hypothetical protein
MKAGIVQGESPMSSGSGSPKSYRDPAWMVEIIVADVVVCAAADIDRNHPVKVPQAVRQA